MELSEVALELQAQRVALQKKYNLSAYIPPSSPPFELDFPSESGGLEPQPIRNTDSHLTLQEMDSLLEGLDL